MTALVQRRLITQGHSERRAPVPQQRVGGYADPAAEPAAAGTTGIAPPGAEPWAEYSNAGPDVFWTAPPGDGGAN